MMMLMMMMMMKMGLPARMSCDETCRHFIKLEEHTFIQTESAFLSAPGKSVCRKTDVKHSENQQSVSSERALIHDGRRINICS